MNIQSKKIGLVVGPLAFTSILLFFHPAGLSSEANAILASTAWVAIWWITEALPISVTALLPIVLFPLTRGLSLKDTTAFSQTVFSIHLQFRSNLGSLQVPHQIPIV